MGGGGVTINPYHRDPKRGPFKPQDHRANKQEATRPTRQTTQSPTKPNKTPSNFHEPQTKK